MRSYKEARQALVSRGFFGSPAYRRQKLRANREGVNPDVLEFEKRFIARCKRMGIPMFTAFAYRDGALQDALYVQGNTRARAGRSPHNHGLAVDIVHSVYAWDVPDVDGRKNKCWQMLGHIGKEVAEMSGIPMRWGGDFEAFWDPAHWELAGWKAWKSNYPCWDDYAFLKAHGAFSEPVP